MAEELAPNGGNPVSRDNPVSKSQGLKPVPWKVGGITPRDVATTAVHAAGYRDFRHLARVVLENNWENLPANEVAKRVNLTPELWEQLVCLEEFLQELAWATIFQYAAQPGVMRRVVERLVNIATIGDDESSLAAQRVYISLLARMGMLPREERPRVNLGMQLNIISNHPEQAEVTVIDDATAIQRRDAS